MTWDQIIALLASVGACVAAFLVLLTLKEMKKQRQTSITPDIIFCKKELYLFICR